MSDKNAKQISRLTLVTDAWQPQVNGVVTTLNNLVNQARKQGIEVDVIQPNDYKTLRLPFYTEIRLAWYTVGLEQRLLDFQPNAIHIATEGSLGWKVRRLALKHQLPFTTSYHTKFPEYVHQRLPLIPESWLYRLLKRFHRPASRTLVPAESIKSELFRRGFRDLELMSRGVDNEVFNPRQARDLQLAKPIHLCVGRVAVEKNLEAFLDLPLQGSKVIVGKGPDLQKLQDKYPDAHFVGAKFGQELAEYYASADVFVFPSLTDTFGVVNIEAIACGTPVAAYPVTGPKDIVSEGVNGSLHENLDTAIQQALALAQQNSAETIAASIPQYTWQGAAKQFINNLESMNRSQAQPAALKNTDSPRGG